MGSTYSEKIILYYMLGIRLSADRPSIFLLSRNLLKYLQCKGMFCYIGRICLCQQLPMVFLEFYGGLISPLAAFGEIQCMLDSFYMGFNISIYASPIYGFMFMRSHVFNSHMNILFLILVLFHQSLPCHL